MTQFDQSSDDSHIDVGPLEAAQRGEGTYRSCAWIEDGAFISTKTVNMCCMEGVGNSGSPVLFNLADESVSAERIIEARRTLRIANQSANAPCQGCYELKSQQWKAKDYIQFVAIAGFMHCNLACGYCTSYHFNPQDRGGDILHIIQEWIASGALRAGSSIDWGGGESTLHKDFEAVAELAFANKVRMLVFTNATGYSAALGEGLAKGLATIVCSVDAGTAETYFKIKAKDLFNRVWANLARYAGIRPDLVTLKYIIMESNCTAREIREFVKKAADIGARDIIISHNTYTNFNSHGRASDAIIFAAAYLMVSAKINGIATKIADVFSGEDREKIISMSQSWLEHGKGFLDNMPAQPGLLDITFTDNDNFLDRVVTAYRDGFALRVVFGHRITVGTMPNSLVALIGAVCPSVHGGQTESDLPAAKIPAELAQIVAERWGSTQESYKEKCGELLGIYAEVILNESGEELVGLVIGRPA